MPARQKPKIGDIIWFKPTEGAEPIIGQLRDIVLKDNTAIITEFAKETHRVSIKLIQCSDVIDAAGPIGDGSVSWEEWQHMDETTRECLVWPHSSRK
jgi:hypothetical protein